MVRIPDKVKKFLLKVKRAFNPKIIYLFGSRATNKFRKESDWDFIIVSEKFSSISNYKRAVAIYKLANGEFAFDVLCLTPKEFDEKKNEPSIITDSIKNKSLVKVILKDIEG